MNHGPSLPLLPFLLTFAAPLFGAEFRTPPAVEPNPNPAAPLAAILRFTVAAPVETTVTVSEGQRKWDVRFDASRNPADGLPIAGFRPGRKHELRVQIRDRAGKVARSPKPLEFTAPALPDAGVEFPPIQVKASDPRQMEPGWTLLSIRRQARGMAAAGGAARPAGKAAGKAGGKAGAKGGGAANPTEPAFATGYGLILALDQEGQVAWYYRSPNRTADVHRLRNGNIAFITNDNRLVEIDLLGNVRGEWCASRRPQGACTGTPVDALTMHHSFQELPNGNFLVVSGELREIDNYYTSETDPKAPRKRQKVMGDQVIEFDRAGRVVWRWSAFDHLDIERLGYLTVNQYWVIRGFPDTLDWTHGNGTYYDERDNSVLFNSRQQSSVIKIERPSGRIAWIFGEPGGWSKPFQPLLFNPAGVSEWPWHHHAPRLTPRGGLMMFNNGIMKARPFEPAAADSEVISGALEYVIDPKGRTAKLVWASDVKGQPETVNTFAMGDVSPLPKTGNVLVVYGSAARNDTRQPWSRVREYVHATPSRVVYDVVFAGAEADSPVSWVAFGGERIARLQ